MMKKIFLLIPLLIINLNLTFGSELTKANEHLSNVEHHTDLSPLLFIIFALIIGIVARYFLSKVGLPYTVVLLIFGISLGALSRFDVFSTISESFHIGNSVDESIDWASNLDPHLILYIFLPILIFEAAFAMNVHTFKKTILNSSLLAVPGILIAIFLTAITIWGLVYFNLGLTNWSWEIVLLFGAVISATDPVAVVSILKELGASKKISTLIEGESLLNDGTAIVIFMVIFSSLTGNAIEHSAILEFFRVAFGGLAIGFVIGKVALLWLKRVKSDMLVESTIIIVSAYLTFVLGEYFFKVSGVLGLVTLGVLMAGPGRTQISTKVQHFIHQFWEFTAFVANTLIFLIVGVVIAKRIVFTVNDVWMLLAVYIIIHLVRIVVIGSLFPIMAKNGYGLSIKDSKVLWWGALRGAIGLALALIVESSPYIDQTIREQFLFLTAGIVTMTLLINATTMKAVANYLGLTKVSPEKNIVLEHAVNYVDQSKNKMINRLKDDRFNKKVDWDQLNQEVGFSIPGLKTKKGIKVSQAKEIRHRLLEKEKNSYWHQFEEGALSSKSYYLLVNEVDDILDIEGHISLSDRKDLDKLLRTKNKINQSGLNVLLKKTNLKKLKNAFEMAKAFYTAQLACDVMIESLERSSDQEETNMLELIEFEVEVNKIQALTYLRNFKNQFPEIYKKISTHKAIVLVLNQEIKTIERLFKQGRITDEEKNKMTKLVDNKILKFI